MATPSWSDKVSIVSAQKVSNGGVARGTLNISSKFGGYVFLRVGRLTTTAPATGINVMVRRLLYDNANTRDIPHPATLCLFQDVLTAANLTTLNGTPSHPTQAVTLASTSGFTGSSLCCIVDSVTTPTRVEWQRASKLAGSVLSFDRNMANAAIANGDTITNQAFVIAPVWFDGTPYAGDVEVIFDYGAEANASPVVVEAWAQTLDQVGSANPYEGGILTLALGGTGADLSAAGPGFLRQATPGAPATVAVLGSTEIPQRHNLLVNGGCQFFQRTDPATLTAISDDMYGPDRWNVLTQTASVQVDRTVGSVSPCAFRLKQNQSTSQRCGALQIVESNDSKSFRSRTVRLQFNAKCSTATTLRYAILEWTGTADAVTSDVVNNWASTSYTAGNFFLASNLSIASTGSTSVGTGYTPCSLSGTISSSCNNLIVLVWTDAAVAQNVTVELAEIQLCDANLVRDWLPEKYADELLRCQRYYQKSWVPDVVPGTTWAGGGDKNCLVVASSSVGMNWNAPLPVTMRASPTVTFYDHAGNPGKMTVFSAGLWTANITINSSIATPTHVGAYTSTTTYQGINFAYVVDAEL